MTSISSMNILAIIVRIFMEEGGKRKEEGEHYWEHYFKHFALCSMLSPPSPLLFPPSSLLPPPLYQIRHKEAACRLNGYSAAAGIVGKLVFPYLSYREIARFGMSNHQPAHRCMRYHHAALRQPYAYPAGTKHLMYYEIYASVGQ